MCRTASERPTTLVVAVTTHTKVETMTATIHIREATYIDPRAGNDKFYRVFVFGNRWVTQYGRNGTVGTFTKIVEASNDERATKAAEAKLASKVKKGYQPSKSGTVTVETLGDDLTVLDQAADTLAPGDTAPSAVADTPVPVTELDAPVRDDLVPAVRAGLAAAEIAGETATPADMRPDLPVRPMLASVQPAQVVSSAMESGDWYAQFKYDGDRVAVEVLDGQIRVLNRQGQAKTRNVGTAQLAAFTALHSGRWVFDGEVVGRTLVLFDLAAATDGAQTWVREDSPFTDRYAALAAIADILGIPAAEEAGSTVPVVLAPLARTETGKADFLATAHDEQREGIILRHRHGSYEPGRRSTTLVKHKLIKDADCVISALHPVKQSADLAVYDENGQLVQVGSASTIGKDARAGAGGVAVGQVWVVTFLYVTDPNHPRMIQPRLVSRRDDKAADECSLAQFADAGTNKTV